MDNLLTVHFHSMHGDYSRYSMWKWLDGYWGEEAHFSREDDFGLVGQVTSPSNRFIDSVNLLVKFLSSESHIKGMLVATFETMASQGYLFRIINSWITFNYPNSIGSIP